jgi:short-subunit dehydrogenase
MNGQLYTLITGASKGFGRALAFECARRRMNLILVALPGEYLDELALHLRLIYFVDAIAIEQNLCLDDSCLELFKEVEAMGVSVNILINNAGVGSTEFFKEGFHIDYDKQIRLNVLATTMITRFFIDMLRKNEPAYILNVGSLASFFSLAKKQVYGATKSYISYFSKSLCKELKHENVFISVICPGGMYTNRSATETIKTGSYICRASCMRPEEVAPIAINGLLRKKEVIVPGKINRIIVLLNRILPRFVIRSLEARTMRRLHNPCRLAPRYNQDLVRVYSEIAIK